MAVRPAPGAGAGHGHGHGLITVAEEHGQLQLSAFESLIGHLLVG
ncbi:hypothetical protein [Streptomyces sp. NPDC050287]